MANPFELQPDARKQWVGAFVAGRARPPLAEPAFPILSGSRTPADWIIERFLELEKGHPLRDNIRETVAELIRAPGDAVNVFDRDQVAGLLLHVAGELDFTEIGSALAGWVRDGWINDDHDYFIGELKLPLRRQVWSLLIGWDLVDELGPQIVRDLKSLVDSNETGTAQSCFVALGQRDPISALEMIPRLNRWHRTYFKAAVHKFVSTVGPATLVTTKYRAAWTVCLGLGLIEPVTSRSLRTMPPLYEYDGNRPNELQAVLKAAGITVLTTSKTCTLHVAGVPPLVIDISRYTDPIGRQPARKQSLGAWRERRPEVAQW